MILIIKKLNIVAVETSEIVFSTLSNETIEELYCECVESKNKYPIIYNRLSNELDKRKSATIEKADSEQCATLDKNVVEQEAKNV